MAQTREERLAYARGYNRARSAAMTRAAKAVAIAKGYRDRLTDTDSARVCVGCDRWTRGGAGCVWGYCRADFEYGLEGRMWADALVGDRQPRPIVTTEEFGCVNWLPMRWRP